MIFQERLQKFGDFPKSRTLQAEPFTTVRPRCALITGAPRAHRNHVEATLRSARRASVQPKLYQQNIPVDHEPLAGQRENIFHYSAPYFNYSAPHFSQITRVPSPKEVRSHIAFHLYSDIELKTHIPVPANMTTIATYSDTVRCLIHALLNTWDS